MLDAHPSLEGSTRTPSDLVRGSYTRSTCTCMSPNSTVQRRKRRGEQRCELPCLEHMSELAVQNIMQISWHAVLAHGAGGSEQLSFGSGEPCTHDNLPCTSRAAHLQGVLNMTLDFVKVDVVAKSIAARPVQPLKRKVDLGLLVAVHVQPWRIDLPAAARACCKATQGELSLLRFASVARECRWRGTVRTLRP